MKRIQIFFFFTLFLMLTACASQVPTPAVTSTLEATVEASLEAQSAYPSPMTEQQAYPGPQGNQPATEFKVTPGIIPVPPSDAPQPEAGKGSISGVLYSISKETALPLNTFFLTPAMGDNRQTPPPFTFGPVKSRGDIIGASDEKAEFNLANVPPGNYFLIAWAAMDWPMAITSPEDQNYRLIQVTADQKNILGIVYIP